MKRLRHFIAFSVVACVLLIGTVWWPIGRYLYVGHPDRSYFEKVDVYKVAAPISILSELARYSLLSSTSGNEDVVEQAQRIIKGQVRLGNYPDITRPLQVTEASFVEDPPSYGLLYAALAIPDILLGAYQKTGNEIYLHGMRKYMQAWYQVVARRIWPLGFLHNDHAIAARMVFYIKCWPTLKRVGDTVFMQHILELASIDAAYLASPLHFTYKTNHGVMQNIGLLLFASAFPGAERANEYADHASQRLKKQLEFFVGTEGFVLENSASYHRFGSYLLGVILRLFSLNKIEIEESLRQRYARAVELDQMLENPDGSLPALGDTTYSATMAKYVSKRVGDSYGPVVTYRTKRYPAVDAILPVSKIAVFGQREYPQAHTIVTWTDFIEHGHKLADDLSLQIWAEGESWLTNIGYWPYGYQNRDKAMGWNGSNAPHYLDEERMTDRQTRILGNVVTSSLKFIEISRKNTDGYEVTRQVTILSPGIWFVLDEMKHLKMHSHETRWTLAPTAQALRQASSYPIYRITSKKSTSIMCLGIMGSAGLTATQVHGDEEQFGGWIGLFDRVLKTDAIRVRSLGQQAWQASIWSLGKSAESCVRTNTVRYRTINNWSWNAQINEKDLSLSREHGTIKIGTDHGVNQTHAIRTYDNELIEQELDQITEALSRLSKEYPRLCVCYPYRLRASYLSSLCLAFAIVALVLSNRLGFQTLYVFCGYGQVVPWTTLAYLIHWWYLV